MGRIGSWLALAVAGLCTLFAIALLVAILSGPYRALERSDYLTYHTAGKIVLAADGDCLYDIACQGAYQEQVTGDVLPFTSPPWMALVAAPLAALPLAVGFGIFTFIGFAALAVAVWRLAAPFNGRDRVVATALVLSSWPTAMAVIRGQASLLVVGLIGLGIAAVAGDKGREAGIFAGLASLKPTLLPLWLARLAIERRWSVLAMGAAVVIGLVAITAVVVSPQALLDYPGFLLTIGTASDVPGVHPEQMMNWRGVEVRLGLEGSGLALAGAAATLAFVAFGWWRNRGLPDAWILGTATALIATPLVIPHSNQHEAMLAGLGALLALGTMRAMRPRIVPGAVGTAAILWLGPLLTNEGGAWLLFAATVAWLMFVTLTPPRPGT